MAIRYDMSTRQAAEFLRTSTSTILLLTRNKKIPAKKRGQRYFYSEEVLLKLLDKGELVFS